MMELNTLYAKATTKSRYGNTEDNFIMDDVVCKGTESSLEECSYNTKDNCGGEEGAGVICPGKPFKDAPYIQLAQAASDGTLIPGSSGRTGYVLHKGRPIW